jgi:SAM-dependent methyltransferase
LTTFQEFSDPKLVSLYDCWDPSRQDTDFFLNLADELDAQVVYDLGCGTGLLSCELAVRGHDVTGVDPSPAMLEVARHRPGGDLVHWIEGEASCLPGAGADLVLMTAHVAQIIRDDDRWRVTLREIFRALSPGGRVAFDSRNPLAQAWLTWTPDQSRRRIEDGEHQQVEVWFEPLESADSELIRYEIHYLFVASGEELVSTSELRFRSRQSITASLGDTGFVVERVFGDWDRRHLDATSPEMIFVAVRR